MFDFTSEHTDERSIQATRPRELSRQQLQTFEGYIAEIFAALVVI